MMPIVKIRELKEQYFPGFKQTSKGVALRNYELSSGTEDLIVKVTNFGPAIVELLARGRGSKSVENIILGFSTIEGYETDQSSQGVIAVGPCANRISGGRFKIHDENLRPTDKWAELDKSDNGNCLHSGPYRWSKRVWKVKDVLDYNEIVAVTYHLPNANEGTGFPGNVDAYVTLALLRGNRLVFEYNATTDVPTIINPVQHLYINLDGVKDRTIVRNTIEGHTLIMYADWYLVTNKQLIPLSVADVKGTRYDLRGRQTRIDEHFKDGKGFDTCFLSLFKPKTRKPSRRAILYSPESGRQIILCSTERATQVYTAEGLGAPFLKQGAICLEAEELVDLVNKYEQFGLNASQVFTTPNNPYYQKTVMTFSHR